ncbi:cytochrome P450 monooxygenase [Lophiostoma macrostomum CBS 122681]|uniref:Cytochrome P450 monooxygenase n=1 Tax=Lophiostoma macrostomum CBS 122681 TaxID=1314788 RepID=A0A6A6TAE4_9PLEO|nr:cytochrome P450 monooxygenase [Lophiostoma macrostomum CBS 122681]
MFCATRGSCRNIPGPSRDWPTGQLLHKYLDGERKSKQWKATHGPIYRLYSGFNPEIVITTAKDVRSFHSDTKHHCKSHASNAGWLFDSLLGKCLGLINGQDWKTFRQAFGPLFTHRSVGRRVSEIAQEIERCMDHKASSRDGVPLDVLSAIQRAPFWCTAIYVYGPLSESERKKLWSLAERRALIFRNILKGGIYSTPWLRFWDRELFHNLQGFREEWRCFNRTMFQKKQDMPSNRPLFGIWDITLDNRGSVDILCQTLDEMLFANLDVSSHVLSSCLYFIAADTSIQRRLRQEIQASETELEAYCQQRNSLLYYCTLEALRLRPIAAFSMPEYSHEEKILSGCLIPAKTHVIIDAYSVNHDPQVWGEESSKFLPDRFLSIQNIDVRCSKDKYRPRC